MRRSKPLAARSAKTKARVAERAAVRELVLERDRGCVARRLVPEVRCASPFAHRAPLEVDEIVGRGRGGDPYDPDNCQALCQAHHDWKTTHPARAEELGLSAKRKP